MIRHELIEAGDCHAYVSVTHDGRFATVQPFGDGVDQLRPSTWGADVLAVCRWLAAAGVVVVTVYRDTVCNP